MHESPRAALALLLLRGLERFPPKWKTGRRKTARQDKKLEPRSERIGPGNALIDMTRPNGASYLRSVIASSALAQTLFWLWTLQMSRHSLLPFDFVFLWLTTPTIALCLSNSALPLAAGLAASAFLINLGLLLSSLGQADLILTMQMLH
jgi:hypothetical protein